MSKSTLGFNILTFTYCGYEIDFVYYYGERGNVELLKDKFTIELPKEEESQNPPFINMIITYLPQKSTAN